MRACGGCAGRSAVAVAFLSVAIAVVISYGGKLGLWQYIDQRADSEGRQSFKGLFPVLHGGTPWEFSLELMPELTGQTYLVTGGNVGLGYWTARHLAAAKATVIIACRSVARCDSAAAGSSTRKTTAPHPFCPARTRHPRIPAPEATPAPARAIACRLAFTAGAVHTPLQ